MLRSLLAALLLLTFAGCTTDDDPCAGASDQDTDGSCGNPTDSGSAEDCTNTADDDGDGAIDCTDTDCAADDACVLTEDCATIGDEDGNELADCADPACTCDPDADGDGSPASLDCDDADALKFPGNPEVCDGQDNDCDGESDKDAVDMDTYYADTDRDGYGDADTVKDSCEIPPGYVTVGTDCNDDDALTYPGAEEACDVEEDTNCDGSVGDDDADADGFIACQDCNDADPTISPDAIEVCDEVDQNCNGDIDEGVQTEFYADADADTFGDIAAPLYACTLPPGGAANSVDCNDGDASINPTAVEVCDGVDQNCNGVVDEAVELSWFVDADGDTYGDVASVTLACTSPGADYISTGGDCDDINADRNPGEAEVCDDGFDNDCNADADCDDSTCTADPSCTAGASEVYCSDSLDDDGDGLTDCDDPDCSADPGCGPPPSEGACSDGLDDDGDGLTDCDDPDCAAAPICAATTTEVRCADGLDDDADGLIDCDDSDCATFPTCVETTCADTFDNDLDGLTDCDDPDCSGIDGCP